MILQSQIRPEPLAAMIMELVSDSVIADQMRAELRRWHYPEAAEQIAATLLRDLREQPQPETQTGVLKLRHG